MNELFRMNEHGDIWQEPTLFDQGTDLPALELCRATGPGRLRCDLPIDHDGGHAMSDGNGGVHGWSTGLATEQQTLT